MTEHKSLVFRFDDVEVREREFLLIKAGEALPVEPKAFRVLLFLVRNPGRLVTKDEVLGAVWNDCAASDNSLTRSIATLRRLLGDDTHEPRYIATVPTVGYRFLCNVTVTNGFPASAVSQTDAESGTETSLESKKDNFFFFVAAKNVSEVIRYHTHFSATSTGTFVLLWPPYLEATPHGTFYVRCVSAPCTGIDIRIRTCPHAGM